MSVHVYMYMYRYYCLALPMLRLLSSKTPGHKDFQKTSKPCHIGVHWIALIEHSQMSTHMQGFQSHVFALAKLTTTSIRVKITFHQLTTRHQSLYWHDGIHIFARNFLFLILSHYCRYSSQNILVIVFELFVARVLFGKYLREKLKYILLIH